MSLWIRTLFCEARLLTYWDSNAMESRAETLGGDVVRLYKLCAAGLRDTLAVCHSHSVAFRQYEAALDEAAGSFLALVSSLEDPAWEKLCSGVDARPETVGRAVVPLFGVAHALVHGVFPLSCFAQKELTRCLGLYDPMLKQQLDLDGDVFRGLASLVRSADSVLRRLPGADYCLMLRALREIVQTAGNRQSLSDRGEQAERVRGYLARTLASMARMVATDLMVDVRCAEHETGVRCGWCCTQPEMLTYCLNLAPDT